MNETPNESAPQTGKKTPPSCFVTFRRKDFFEKTTRRTPRTLPWCGARGPARAPPIRTHPLHDPLAPSSTASHTAISPPTPQPATYNVVVARVPDVRHELQQDYNTQPAM